MARKTPSAAVKSAKRGHDIPRLVHAFDQQQRAKGRADRRAGRGARRRGGGLHAVVFEDGHLAQPPAPKRANGIPDHEGQHARGDGHPERPAQLERGVEVGDGHEHAQHAAHQHGAQGQLLLPVAAAGIDLLKPLPLDFVRRALEPLNRQIEVGVRGSARRSVGRPGRFLQIRGSSAQLSSAAGVRARFFSPPASDYCTGQLCSCRGRNLQLTTVTRGLHGSG